MQVIDFMWNLDAALLLGCAGAVAFLLGTVGYVRNEGGPRRDDE